MGRMYVESGERVRRFLSELMGEIARRFTSALARALPELPFVELLWRMNFAVGVVVHSLAGRYHLEMLAGGSRVPGDPGENVERMVAFIAAGFRAPVSTGTGKG